MHPPFLLLAGLLMATAGVSAQSMQPGLWNMQNKVGGNPEMDQAMAQMQKQLASMPPAQRKQMEAMMGKSGVNIGQGGAISVKACITPEMASRMDLPSQNQGDCKTTIVSRSASQMKMNFVCTQPPSNGEGVYTFSGDKAYSMKMVIHSTQNGKPHSMTVEGQGQWIAADCGAVKPVELPPAKK
jgi:Protein of unknown function (DUF3617)